MTAGIAAAMAAVSTCIAAWQGVLMKRSERNRTQPIAVEGEPEAGLEPLADQETHEIKLPPELENMESVLDLYEMIEKEYALDRDSSRLTRKGESGHSRRCRAITNDLKGLAA